jgi:uncharacterized protein (DUF2141 family)
MSVLPFILIRAMLASHPSLGVAEGVCRPAERGPAILIDVDGMKDRRGLLRAELYPPTDPDFLADDNVLLSEGKTFRRVEIRPPEQGNVQLCIRAPAAGTYSLILLHDRDGNRKFTFSTDGVGFPNNPRLGLSQPKAAAARIMVGNGVVETRIVLNYRHGLFSFRPLKKDER